MQKNEINIETVVKIIKKLYWLGLIGIAGSAFDIPILKLFYLFFLLAIIDFILSLIIVLRTEGTDETVNDLKFLFQNLGMLIGIPFIYIRNMFQLPNVDTYTPEIHIVCPLENVGLSLMEGIIKKPHIHGVFAIRGMLMTSIFRRMVQPFQAMGKM